MVEVVKCGNSELFCGYDYLEWLRCLEENRKAAVVKLWRSPILFFFSF